jgi:uncharacterized protein (AIM24 family)
MPDTHNYTCPWCGQPSTDVSQNSCGSCGSPLDVRLAVSKSGWTELPPIKDMAKLQFGQSFCQIEGSYVPVADFKLAEGDGIYFTHHLLLWKDPTIQIARMPLAGGAWRRMLAGLPLVMMQAQGAGRLAFSRDKPGDIVALPLSPGQAVDVCEHVFMVATSQILYHWIPSGIWFDIREDKSTTRHYPMGQYFDRFTAGKSPGLLLLHGAGNVFVRRLEANQRILVKPTALLFKDPTVTVNMLIEHPGGAWQQATRKIWAQRCLWARLTGPGRVAIQSHYERWEDPDEPVYQMEPGGRVRDW